LVLDEPTNHLDLKSKEILKTALKRYDGTLVVISHDRDFLDGLVTEMYEFSNGNVKQFIGGVYDFLKSKKVDSIKEFERKDKQQVVQNNTPTENKLSYEERKNQERALKKAENDVQKIETLITELEQKISTINEQLLNPSTYSQELVDKYTALKKQLEKAEIDWEKAQETLEKIN
jgi:ATP-binding cassette subfamily F protein 3